MGYMIDHNQITGRRSTYKQQQIIAFHHAGIGQKRSKVLTQVIEMRAWSYYPGDSRSSHRLATSQVSATDGQRSRMEKAPFYICRLDLRRPTVMEKPGIFPTLEGFKGQNGPMIRHKILRMPRGILPDFSGNGEISVRLENRDFQAGIYAYICR
jgi:hypothetical protein